MADNTTEPIQEKFKENEIFEDELLRRCILADYCKMENLESSESLNLKTREEILTRREKLECQLNELKKENFCIRASINAWQDILNSKLEEFKQADFTLNEIYDNIWTERENFCSRVDEFNEEFGVLSEWWEKQMKFVSELESLEKKTLEGKQCQEEIKKLEEEVNELEKEIHTPQETSCQRVVEAEVHVAGDDAPRNEEEPEEEGELGPKSSKSREKMESLESELFSMVDIETVRMANRKHRRSKHNFLTRVKEFLKK